jgi:flavin reductase (DIM6/NTAB) family NADH-FMN oxidoreductase RutF
MATDLELALAGMLPRERYRLLSSLVVPRPIAWICTLDGASIPNLAPFSYFNLCSLTPPIVHFTATSSTDTIANIASHPEFVVNILDEDLHAAIGAAQDPGGDLAPAAAIQDFGGDFARLGLEPLASTAVAPPRIARAKGALECRVRETMAMGEGVMVFGDVQVAHVDQSVWREDEVDAHLLRPVGRLGGSHYATLAATTPASDR